MTANPKTLGRQYVKGGATTLILSVLRETPVHGYELIQVIRERSEGIFDFSDGTVYPLLYSLRDKGWVRTELETSERGRRRKIYHLTEDGRAALDALVADWDLFARGMQLSLGKAQ
jgi:DNA-binding PadR family transcriptional regulator